VRFGQIQRMLLSYLLQYWQEFILKRGTTMAMEQLANFIDEVTEGQSSVRVEEERDEGSG